jgi:predicted nuclease with RNAse H fold
VTIDTSPSLGPDSVTDLHEHVVPPATYDRSVFERVAVGVDVGVDRLHIVVIDHDGQILDTAVFDPADEARVASRFASLPAGSVVAIDGPPGPSASPFADDTAVSPKFRLARGCEVELGRQRGIWVSFATGPEPLIGWMAEGARIHQLSESLGLVALETYPHAIFRTLLGRRPAKKTTGQGITERVNLLRHVGVREPTLGMWSHDALDAAAAAIVAHDHLHANAIPITCAIDDTTIWLPAAHPRH